MLLERIEDRGHWFSYITWFWVVAFLSWGKYILSPSTIYRSSKSHTFTRHHNLSVTLCTSTFHTCLSTCYLAVLVDVTNWCLSSIPFSRSNLAAHHAAIHTVASHLQAVFSVVPLLLPMDLSAGSWADRLVWLMYWGACISSAIVLFTSIQWLQSAV